MPSANKLAAHHPAEKRIPSWSLLNKGGKPVRKWSTTAIRKYDYKQLKVQLHTLSLW